MWTVGKCVTHCLPVEAMPAALRKELERDLKAFAREKRTRNRYGNWDGLPCIWLDLETRRCKHYKFRPSCCREAIAPGDDACNYLRRMFPPKEVRQ
jgi:Fe-S-cluster containining protein